jgi:hypothetical protein
LCVEEPVYVAKGAEGRKKRQIFSPSRTHEPDLRTQISHIEEGLRVIPFFVGCCRKPDSIFGRYSEYRWKSRTNIIEMNNIRIQFEELIFWHLNCSIPG